MPSVPVVRVHGIRKTYGRAVAVDDVSFEVPAGEIFGLIGPNGAGKTTTMECVEGLRRPDRGRIDVFGLDPPAGRPGVAAPHRGGSFRKRNSRNASKVWEAVDLWASLYDVSVDTNRTLDQLGLGEKRDAWFMTLSGGQKQRLFIALALINDPELVFLDELTTGLGPPGPAHHLGPGARHPGARQDGLSHHPPDGGSRAVVQPGRHHRSRSDHRPGHPRGPHRAALPPTHRGGLARPTTTRRPASGRSRPSIRSPSMTRG